MLVNLRYFKVIEENNEYKKVIYAQRFFDQVSRQEFQGGFFPFKIIDQTIKGQGQGDPEGAETQSFLYFNHMRIAVEHEKIQAKHCQHEKVKNYPERNVVTHKFKGKASG